MKHKRNLVRLPSGPANRDEVIRISLSQFPMPSDATSWENIMDFKNESSSLEMFHRLKNWMNKISKQELKNYEMEDELAGMMATYRSQMHDSMVKAQMGVLEAIITVPLEFAQHVVRLKFGDAAKMFFKVSKQRLTLLEEERKATGNEIAYIVKAQEQFGR